VAYLYPMTTTITTREIADATGLTRAGVFVAAKRLKIRPAKGGDHRGPSLWRRADLARFVNRHRIMAELKRKGKK